MKRKSLHRYLFRIAILSILIAGFFVVPTHASKVSKKATFSVYTHSQGATLTKDYYVFTSWNKNKNNFVVKRCKRSKTSSCKSTKTVSGKPSSMYHEWGTAQAQAILKENSGCYRIQISNMKVSSKQSCSSSIKSDGLSVSGDVKGRRQGWTKYGSYYLRGYGTNDSGSISNNRIWLFNSSKSLKNSWKIPLSYGEVEDVMVDGDTGRVWFTYGTAGSISYYIVDKSVFSKWIKPASSSSNPSSGGGGGSSDDDGSSGDDDSGSTKRIITNKRELYKQPESPGYDGSLNTTFFGNMKEDDKGCGTYMVINFIIEILTYGIGIAAAIGLSVSGIKYLTAKGNEAQTTKSKRRIYEIFIGLLAYSILWAILNFALPGGVFNNSTQCGTATKDTSIYQNPIKVERGRQETVIPSE